MALLGILVLSRVRTAPEPDERQSAVLVSLVPALAFTVTTQVYAVAFLAHLPEAGGYARVFDSEPLTDAAATGGQIVAALAIAFVLERGGQEREPTRAGGRAPLQLRLGGLFAIVTGGLAAMTILLPIWEPPVYVAALGLMIAALVASFALILGAAVRNAGD